MYLFIYYFLVRIENSNNPYPGLKLPVEYNMDLNDIDINEEGNDWDPINREFRSEIFITSEDDGRGYEVVSLDRDELAYKSEVKLTGYCNAENDQNNNLWVTMESPFLTKKITQKFPLLPGYSIPENNTRAVGDNEIDITENGSYILGQNDEDLDDLEINLDNNNSNSNPQRSLNLSKTRDTIDPTYTLGKFNVNVNPPTITSPITSNGYYKFDGNTLISGTNQDYNLNVQVSSTTPRIIINNISIDYLDTSYVMKIAVNGRYSITDQTYSYLFLTLYNGYYYLHLILKNSSSVSEVVIDNDTGNIMRVFRISNTSSPKNILFRYYHGNNYINVTNVRTSIVSQNYSTNANQLTTNISFNQSYYDMSSFF